MKLSIVILAAGEGKRMFTQQPKVLQPVAALPMLSHVINTAKSLDPEQICVVYGYQGKALKDIYAEDSSLTWVEQAERLGTGHAVLQAMPHIPRDHYVLVLFGDVPLITTKTLTRLVNITLAQNAGLGLLAADVDNPFGLGRIIRNVDGHIIAIVEEKDASIAQKAVREIFTGILVARANLLHEWLPNLSNNNAQGEYYLTELPAMAVKESISISSGQIESKTEILGANTRHQLATLERAYQKRLAEELMEQGVSLKDPARIDIRGQIKTGFDVVIDINNVFEGTVILGDNVYIEPNCIIKNAQIGSHTRINANTIIDGATVGDHVEVGPFARIRPGSVLQDKSRVGNFVEIKKTILGEGSKASHLSYLGDAIIGKNVNVGAGTITCNYDGINKYQTIIEDAVFIGSDTQLIAPVTIGYGVTVGAGSTISKDVPPGGLVVSRVEQKHYPDWVSPKEGKKKSEKLTQVQT